MFCFCFLHSLPQNPITKSQPFLLCLLSLEYTIKVFILVKVNSEFTVHIMAWKISTITFTLMTGIVNYSMSHTLHGLINTQERISQ